MTVVSPFLIFPPVSWWMQVVSADVVLLDAAEHFQKMTGRNRYRIAGANNAVLLTVPVARGRDQHTSMRDIKVFNETLWQVQHWRTLVSAYKRSPYFDHYEDSLRPLFEASFEQLTDFGYMSIEWVRAQLKLSFEIRETDVYEPSYPGYTDLRHTQPPVELPKYYQVFEDRIGFLPDLSILDLLFSEGPAGVELLRKN